MCCRRLCPWYGGEHDGARCRRERWRNEHAEQHRRDFANAARSASGFFLMVRGKKCDGGARRIDAVW
jgi:hypothetical protein